MASTRNTGPGIKVIFALVDDRDRAYFGRRNQDTDEIGFMDAETQAIFGRTYAAEPDALIRQLKEDEAIAAADTLLLTVPNQLGVDYNAHVIDTILTHVAPALGWRQPSRRSARSSPAQPRPQRGLALYLWPDALGGR